MSHRPEAHERPHPTAMTYIAVASVLTVVTVLEVAIYYIEALRPALVPLLLLLSATKFALVVMFYMHLKFDHKLFSALFVGGLWLAIGVIVALLALFQALIR
ncbi:MAG: cytochrome C oxidase subunit IV family protein [Chloroflexi bacterium]|nr:cytochrome C oxidase subunit IV family protein [Chloroflexota bacterium]